MRGTAKWTCLFQSRGHSSTPDTSGPAAEDVTPRPRALNLTIQAVADDEVDSVEFGADVAPGGPVAFRRHLAQQRQSAQLICTMT